MNDWWGGGRINNNIYVFLLLVVLFIFHFCVDLSFLLATSTTTMLFYNKTTVLFSLLFDNIITLYLHQFIIWDTLYDFIILDNPDILLTVILLHLSYIPKWFIFLRKTSENCSTSSICTHSISTPLLWWWYSGDYISYLASCAWAYILYSYI